MAKIIKTEKAQSPEIDTSRGKEEKEYILCSAIYFNDGKEYEHQPNNIKTGFVISGRRHHNCYSTLQSVASALGMEEIALRKFERIDRDSQGFITNLNRYVDRKEGYKIAKSANQIVIGSVDDNNPILISENLY